MLTHPDILQKLVNVCCQGEDNIQNLPYALNLLYNIIKEFNNPEKEIPEERKGQIQEQFARFFTDLAYNCILLLKQNPIGDNTYVNQTQKQTQKIGIHRIRAIELLKMLFSTLTKIKDGKKMISSLLKTKVINTMLYVIKNFPFCNIASQ
jgi:hypothetical protein